MPFVNQYPIKPIRQTKPSVKVVEPTDFFGSYPLHDNPPVKTGPKPPPVKPLLKPIKTPI